MADNDGNERQPPNYADERFQQLRQQVAEHLNLPDNDIVQHLGNLWLTVHGPRQQQEEEQVQQPPANRDHPPALDDHQAELPLPPPAPDKKKSIRITTNRMVSKRRLPDPSDYAIRKLRNQDFVELWYFSPKGCVEAARSGNVVDAESFSLTQVDNTIHLRPSRTTLQPKDVVPDHLLSWTEMTVAKNNMIDHMQKCDWDEATVNSFMLFYIALDTHTIRPKEYGDRALLKYQAEVRKEWHNEAARQRSNPEHPVFDISVINEDRLEAIREEIYQELRDRSLAE